MNTTPREIKPMFPADATDREKVVITLMFPRQFVRWCRTQVGVAPSARCPNDGCCVVEQYLLDVTGTLTYVSNEHIRPRVNLSDQIITPTWVRRIVAYVDDREHVATYSSVANLILAALERGELA